jgi:hypothetical protein
MFATDNHIAEIDGLRCYLPLHWINIPCPLHMIGDWVLAG